VKTDGGRAQESRQDISLSGTGVIEPFIASSTDVQVHSNYALGALVSYRFMLTPNEFKDQAAAFRQAYDQVFREISKVIVTNTIPRTIDSAKVEHLTIAQILADAIKRITSNRSVSELFNAEDPEHPPIAAESPLPTRVAAPAAAEAEAAAAV